MSPYLCDYRKGFSTQQALLSLIEKWKNSLDKKGYGRAVLMDFSKASEMLNHDLLLSKLHAIGFTTESLKLIKSCLVNRWQRTKVNTNFSDWSELLRSSTMIRYWTINDLFDITEMTNVCNYANDTTFDACDSD